MLLEIDTLSGFNCADEEILIYTVNPRLKPFYFKKNPYCEKVIFNLPIGIYETENAVSRVKPLVYYPPKLPQPERRTIPPKKLTIFVGENPNKCSINRHNGKILIDDRLTFMPLPFIHFILFHELGHYFYKSEYKADIYAAAEMLNIGYNPTQVMYAQYLMLSDHQRRRKAILLKFLKQTKTN